MKEYAEKYAEGIMFSEFKKLDTGMNLANTQTVDGKPIWDKFEIGSVENLTRMIFDATPNESGTNLKLTLQCDKDAERMLRAADKAALDNIVRNRGEFSNIKPAMSASDIAMFMQIQAFRESKNEKYPEGTFNIQVKKGKTTVYDLTEESDGEMAARKIADPFEYFESPTKETTYEMTLTGRIAYMWQMPGTGKFGVTLQATEIYCKRTARSKPSVPKGIRIVTDESEPVSKKRRVEPPASRGEVSVESKEPRMLKLA